MESNDIKSYLFERAFSMKSSLSIIAQTYLCKFNDTLSMFAFMKIVLEQRYLEMIVILV